MTPAGDRNDIPRSDMEPANPAARGSDGISRPRVVYWNNIPTPYMVDRFNAIADRGNLGFEAWFSTRTEPDRTWVVDEASWRFRYRYLPGIGLGQRRVELPMGLLGRRRPDLIVSLYASPSFLFGRLLARATGVKAAFWTEVTFDASRGGPRRRWKEALKRAVFPTLDGVITVGQDGRRFAQRYGTPSDRIFLAPHAIDVERFATVSAAAREDRDGLRARLGVAGCTFLYVGRLWRGKGLDSLLEAFGTVSGHADAPVTLLIVGDGPDEARLRRRVVALGLSNIVFAGFRQSDELPEFYAASDVFVFPTLGDTYGLVLDEAMACSLPLISTSAAGELGLRIEHGQNGLIVPPADPAALAAAMSELELDPHRRAQMGAESRRRVAGRTPERWAEDFERAVRAILAGGARHRRFGRP
jgi:glycosyltransferase involved in cell wall biosynthesis